MIRFGVEDEHEFVLSQATRSLEARLHDFEIDLPGFEGVLDSKTFESTFKSEC